MVDRCPIRYLTTKGYETQCNSLAGHWGRHEYDLPPGECRHPHRDDEGRCYGCHELESATVQGSEPTK